MSAVTKDGRGCGDGRSYPSPGPIKVQASVSVAQFGRVGVGVFLVRTRCDSGQAIDQLSPEQLVTDTALRLQHPAVPMAARTGDGPAQHRGGLRCNVQVETMCTSWILADGPINHAGLGLLR